MPVALTRINFELGHITYRVMSGRVMEFFESFRVTLVIFYRVISNLPLSSHIRLFTKEMPAIIRNKTSEGESFSQL